MVELPKRFLITRRQQKENAFRLSQSMLNTRVGLREKNCHEESNREGNVDEARQSSSQHEHERRIRKTLKSQLLL